MDEHKMVPMACAKRNGILCSSEYCPMGFKGDKDICSLVVKEGQVYYYEPCHGERPGDVDEEFKAEGKKMADAYGVEYEPVKGGGYWIHGERKKVELLLCEWYDEEEIYLILTQGTTDYED